jgi:hypothetical protein
MPEIVDITLSLHERPYRPVDLFSAGLEIPTISSSPLRNRSGSSSHR